MLKHFTSKKATSEIFRNFGYFVISKNFGDGEKTKKLGTSQTSARLRLKKSNVSKLCLGLYEKPT